MVQLKFPITQVSHLFFFFPKSHIWLTVKYYPMHSELINLGLKNLKNLNLVESALLNQLERVLLSQKGLRWLLVIEGRTEEACRRHLPVLSSWLGILTRDKHMCLRTHAISSYPFYTIFIFVKTYFTKHNHSNRTQTEQDETPLLKSKIFVLTWSSLEKRKKED